MIPFTHGGQKILLTNIIHDGGNDGRKIRMACILCDGKWFLYCEENCTV